MELYQLTKDTLGFFQPLRVLNDHTFKVQSISTSRNLLASSGGDDFINLYNLHSASRETCIQSEIYGTSFVSFTQDPHTLLTANSKGHEGIIRLIDFQEPETVELYQFQSRVTSLELHPTSNYFLTTYEKSLKLQSITEKNSFLKKEFGLPVISNFDPSGTAIFVGSQTGIEMLDTRKLSDSIRISSRAEKPNHLEVSDDGKFLLSTGESTRVLDAWNGQEVFNIPEKVACFTPDSKFVCGVADKTVNMYDAQGNLVFQREEDIERINCIVWSKDFALMATASTNILLWVPSLKTN